MKFSLRWLKTFLETSATPQEISEALTSLGLEVESLEDQSTQLAPFKVAYVKHAERHPDADRLQVCRVDVGNGQEKNIVCGAPNARAGLWTVFAPIGATIPANGMVLKPSKIRGVESQGMLCSGRELGLSEEADGIMELSQEGLRSGDSFAKICGLEEVLFEVGITPNRPDCFGIHGIARDLAAKGIGTLRTPEIQSLTESFANPIDVIISPSEHPEACSQFIGRLIRGAKNGPSPQWLQDCLKSAGMTPISTLVDITNYISTSFARPLHVFDASKISGPLTVRFAQEGEMLEALNDKTYTLDTSILVISDTTGPQAIAGIIGGKASACSMDTTDVLLECAHFDAVMIARAGQKLQITTDARQRFERGADPLSLDFGSDYATQLILELCGGTSSQKVSRSTLPLKSTQVTFTFDAFIKRTGVALFPAEMLEILKKLGFNIIAETKTYAMLGVPSWRPDVTIEDDVIEEVLRVVGFDKLPLTPLPDIATQHKRPCLSITQQKGVYLKRLMASRGLLETFTYSFISESEAALFGADSSKSVTLANPLSQDMSVLRPSILPSFLKAFQTNQNRGFSDISLFELGPIFKGHRESDQILTLSGLRTGQKSPSSWGQKGRIQDLSDVKADALAALHAWGISENNIQITRANIPAHFHPHLSGTIQQGPKNILGHFGAIHPKVLKFFDLNADPHAYPVGFELFVGAWPAPKNPKLESFHLSPFQRVTRDFAFVMDEKTEIGPLLTSIPKLAPDLIEDVHLFDVYQGKGIEPGKKSIALRVMLAPKNETLKDSDIQELSRKIIETAEKVIGAILRA